MSEGIATDIEACLGDNKNKCIKKTGDKETPPTICLFVEHGSPDMFYSMYMINLPLEFPDIVDSDGFMMYSKFIRPILTFPEQISFLGTPASVSLGSKIYLFGGNHEDMDGLPYPEWLPYQVQVFDTDHPHLGMRTVAPTNGPKETPCVFVADGMIYALGSAVPRCKRALPDDCKGSGYFERYHPSSDHWEVLPDPPAPFLERNYANYLDSGTVVGRLVFISAYLHVVFNLDTLDWEPRLLPGLAAYFPFGSFFVEDTASLYHLQGHGVRKPGTVDFPGGCYGEIQVVKKGPLTITKEGDTVGSLLKSNCLVSRKKQVMVERIDLDENIFFTEYTYSPWRNLFHMGGRFFCYVVTAQLVKCQFFHTEGDFNTRGVFIKFFEEVQAHADNSNGDCNNDTKFRPLASFCYKIKTDFMNASCFNRCCVLGSVPDSWVKEPMKKKLETMKTEQKRYEAEQTSHELVDDSQVENTMNRESGVSDLMKLLAVREDTISRLMAELAEKNERLKAYEDLLASQVMENMMQIRG